MVHPLLLKVGDGDFSPLQFNGLFLWLDASQLGLADAAAIATWNDLSSNGRNFSQGTADNRPAFKAAIQNGRGIARFDGSNDFLQSVANQTLSQPSTWFVVARRTGNTSAYNRVLYTVDNGELGFDNEVNTTYIYAGEASYPDEAAADSAFHIIAGGFKANSSILRVDGVQGVGDIGPNNIANQAMFIGHSTNPLAGDVGEIILYSGQLSTADIGRVESYLASKWGIAIS